MGKRLPKANTLRGSSSLSVPDWSFWFSHDLKKWYQSTKCHTNKMVSAERVRLRKLKGTIQDKEEFKRKHG